MMSFYKKQCRTGGEEETWPEETIGNASPPSYNISEQIRQLEQETRSLFCRGATFQPPKPDICYPEFGKSESGILYSADCLSSSPVVSDQDFICSSQFQDFQEDTPTLNYYEQCASNNIGLIDFFGEQFLGMEETFRSALLQYFSQVDQEKVGLTDDLKKIKDDFCKYEAEGRKFKIDNIQKGKIIRKLTENGKLFVKEIEKLKDEIRTGELQRRQLIAENNELQKKVDYENETIPHLENELRCLAEENQYLKLLADDTKKLNQQENEIRKYASQLDHQHKICKQQANNLNKQAYAIKKLSGINDELCSKINELSVYKNVNEKLKETEHRHANLQHEYKCLQAECQNANEQAKDLNITLNNLEKELLELKRENCAWQEKNCYLEKDYIEKDCVIKKLKIKLQNFQIHHENDVNDLKAKEQTCRDLSADNFNLKKEIDGLKKTIELHKIKTDSLLYGDEMRNKDFENLERKNKELEKKCNEISNQERQLQSDIMERDINIEALAKRGNVHEQHIKDLQHSLQNSKDTISKLEIKCEQQMIREKQLESEILSHTKTESEMEQEITLTYKTMEILRRSNENCEEQRAKLQQELLVAQGVISDLESEHNEDKIIDAESKRKLEVLQQRYDACENQRNRLQKELLIQQEKMSSVELAEAHYNDMKKQLEECKIECTTLKKSLVEAQNRIDHCENKNNSEKQNSFLCSSDVEEWHVDLICGMINERPYQNINNKTAVLNHQAMNKLTDELHESECDIMNRNVNQQVNGLKSELNSATISLRELKYNSKLKEEEIEDLKEENKQLQTDLHDIVSEFECSRKDFKLAEKKLEEKEIQVEELHEKCLKSDKLVKDRNNLIDELETLIEELQRKLSKLSNKNQEDETNFQEIQQYSLKLNKELAEKNRETSDLEIHCKKLQQSNKRKDDEIDDLLRQIDQYKQLLSQLKKSEETDNDLQILKEKIDELEGVIEQKDNKIKELLTSDNRPLSKGSADKVGSLCEESTEYVREDSSQVSTTHGDILVLTDNIRDQNSRITELEKENIRLSEELFTSEHKQIKLQPHSLDYSFEDENSVSKTKYLDLLDTLDKKKNLINDLQEHIQLLQKEEEEILFLQEDTEENLQRFEIDESMNKKTDNKGKSKQGHIEKLQLPKPDILSNQSTPRDSTQKRNSLPPVPDNGSTYVPTPRPPLGANDLRGKYQEQTSQKKSKMTKEREKRNDSNADELRRKLVQLNSELLQRKMNTNRLEEELVVTKRKQARAEKSYRNVVVHNESLENEIMENRRKIRNVQFKQSTSDVTENQCKREMHALKVDLENMEKRCDGLSKENNILDKEIKSKEEINHSTQNKFEHVVREVDHWEKNVEMLERECQELTTNIETLQSENLRQKSEIESVKLNLELVKKERDSWKRNTQTQESQCGDLKSENNMLQDEVFAKLRLSEKIKEQLNVTEQEREIFELKLKESEMNMRELQDRIMESEEDKKELKNQKDRLEELMHGSDQAQKDLMSEKELAQHNTRYMENKIEELKNQMKLKDERIHKCREKQDHSEEKNADLSSGLSQASLELKRLTKELSKESQKISHLEKLNDEMNKENKRLMHELVSLQDKLRSIAGGNEIRKEKILKLEKEQKSLDNLLIKTQKSNSELLESNKNLNGDLRNSNDQISQLDGVIDARNNEKLELERRLLTTEKELHHATEKLSAENQELIQELHDARRIINELEAILDQGQVDFDEMDAQLDRYRRENIELDEKLHEVLKQQIKLQREREESTRRIPILSDELCTLREQLEKEKRDYQVCMKEKEEIEGKLQECKSREEYFEERLQGFEKILNGKEEVLRNEKKDKEKLQDELLKLQSELIETKSHAEKLRVEREERNKDISQKQSNIEFLEKSEMNLSLEKEDLTVQLRDKTKNLLDYEKGINRYKEERDEIESKYHEILQHTQGVESQLEDKKMERHNEREELLAEISNLKRNINEKEILNEKQSYQQITKENDLKEALESNKMLEEKIKELEVEYFKEKQKLVETVNDWQQKTSIIELEKSQELIHLKATMEAVEESRGHDISLLKIKLKETEDLKRKIDGDRREQSQREMEIEALKDDIIQLQTTLNNTEAKNDELLKNINQVKTHIAYLEKNKYELDLDKVKLIDDKREKEDYIKNLQEQNETEQLEKHNLMSEKESLQTAFEHILQDRESENERQENEIRTLRAQLIPLESIKQENDNLKSDLDAILNERRDLHNKLSEHSQLRAEIIDLQGKADSVQDVMNENKMLKQELRDVENRHIELLDRVNRENSSLRRSVDDLFKQNQDLELRNVNYVRTRPISSLYFEPTTPRADPVTLSIGPKSASVNNINDIGFEMESFSPLKNGVATSTPTQENMRFTSVMVTRAPSAERINSASQMKVSSIESPTKRKTLLNGPHHSLSSQKDQNQLSSGPLVQGRANEIRYLDEINPRKTDASWYQPKEENLHLSIKSNPFFQMDKSAKSNWKAAADATKSMSASANSSPTKSSQQNNVLLFDMRPQSADIPENSGNVTKSPNKPIGIGNEFVNRLKATFENK